MIPHAEATRLRLGASPVVRTDVQDLLLIRADTRGAHAASGGHDCECAETYLVFVTSSRASNCSRSASGIP